MVLGGDLNTSLNRIPHCVGLNDFQDTHGRRSGPRHPDSGLLGGLLAQRGLTAINTWDTSLGPTYTGGHSNKSRIDFILVRHKSSDSLTKKPVYLDQLPQMFGHSKDHVPILFTVPYKWRAWARSPPGIPRGQQDLLLRRWDLQSEDWHHLCSSLEKAIGALWTQPPDLGALNQVILEGCKDFAPNSRGPQDRPPTIWTWAEGHPGLSLPAMLPGPTSPAGFNSFLGTGQKPSKFKRGNGQPIKRQGSQESQALQHH